MCFVAGSAKINMSMIVVSWTVRRSCEGDHGVRIIEGIGTYGGRASNMPIGRMLQHADKN
jgi:hypothetical protein